MKTKVIIGLVIIIGVAILLTGCVSLPWSKKVEPEVVTITSHYCPEVHRIPRPNPIYPNDMEFHVVDADHPMLAEGRRVIAIESDTYAALAEWAEDAIVYFAQCRDGFQYYEDALDRQQESQ